MKEPIKPGDTVVVRPCDHCGHAVAEGEDFGELHNPATGEAEWLCEDCYPCHSIRSKSAGGDAPNSDLDLDNDPDPVDDHARYIADNQGIIDAEAYHERLD